MNIIYKKSILGVSIVFAFYVIFLLVQYVTYDVNYDALERGTSKAEVLAKFGKPYSIDTSVWAANTSVWECQPIRQTVVELYCYEVYPQQWFIGFDNNGKAIAKQKHSLP